METRGIACVRGLAWFFAFCLGVACQSTSSGGLCLDQDLGPFHLVRILPEPGEIKGCHATYRDDRGHQVVVRVIRDSNQASPKSAAPVPFEKSYVYASPEGDGTRVNWRHQDLSVEMFLSGMPEPQGAVLRAYLMHIPSDVVSEVDEVKQTIETLRAESREVPKSAALHLELSRKYRKLGNNIMAAQELHAAVDLDKTCYGCYFEMGVLYQELRHWDLSIKAFRRAADLGPGEKDPQLGLGDVFYQVHNRDGAMEAYRRAEKLNLTKEERQRVESRLQQLKDGQFMIEMLPGAQK
jgi:hypothetical protein